jgi:hypothetical protein
MKIEQNTKSEDIHIYSVGLVVLYSVYGSLLELRQETTETSTFKISVLDQDIDKETDGYSIEFCSSNELIKIIEDFKKKLNNSKK